MFYCVLFVAVIRVCVFLFCFVLLLLFCLFVVVVFGVFFQYNYIVYMTLNKDKTVPYVYYKNICFIITQISSHE